VLIKNVFTLSDGKLKKTDIHIKEGRIKSLGDELKVDDKEVYDFSGKIVLPGFVNTHNHIAMSLFRGYAEDVSFNVWLFQKILPAEERLTPEMIYYASLLSMMEMASHGIVAFCDMYFHEEEIARAVSDFGMKALLTRGLIDKSGDDGGRLRENIELYEKWNGYDGRIFVGLGPHAPYSCSTEYLKKIIEIAKAYDMPVTMHFFENKWEWEKYTPEEIIQLGFDEVHFIPVHCTQLDYESLRLLNGSYPSVNTVSNMKLGNGLPPINEMIRNGLKITIGTDGPASNNSQNVLFDLRVSVLASKMHNPELFNVSQAFYSITQYGYEALRLKGGKVAVNYPADLVFINSNHVQLQPLDNLIENLIHAYNDTVYATMVNGRFIFIDGKFPMIDVQEVLEKFSTFSKKATGIGN
jgi:5-methylthioadenosine/S-adenosylhomocysteine deaminase